MRLVHEVVKERLNQKRNLMKKRYDKSASLHQFNVGDSVLLRDVVLHENEKRKFHLPYRGPYKVIEVCAPNYDIANEDRSFVKRVHFNRLKPSFGDYSRESHAQPPTPVNDQVPSVGFYMCSKSQQPTNASRDSNCVINSEPHAQNNARPLRSRRRPSYYPDADRDVYNATP